MALSVQIKLLRCTSWRQEEGVEVQHHSFIPSALDGGDCAFMNLKFADFENLVLIKPKDLVDFFALLYLLSRDFKFRSQDLTEFP
jgi:hypothetical protein